MMNKTATTIATATTWLSRPFEIGTFFTIKQITKAKGHEPALYEALKLLLVFSLKFAIVKMNGPNKQLNLEKHTQLTYIDRVSYFHQ